MAKGRFCSPVGYMMSTPFPSCQKLLMLGHVVTRSWGQHHLESVTSPTGPVMSLRFSLPVPCSRNRCLQAAAKFQLALPVWHGLPGRGTHQVHGAKGPLSDNVCHSCLVTCSCREDRGGVPASPGELWRLGRAGRASRGQPVWRSEESCGLCPDDCVLVIFSQMLLIFLWLLHWEALSTALQKPCP